MSSFSDTIIQTKYAHTLADGTKETWAQIAYRVASSVFGPYYPTDVARMADAIEQKKFLPAGRYLYAAGKPIHQVQNCLLLSVEDSREGWASLMQRVTSGLMTGAGVGVVYSALREEGAPVRGMGGTSTGPIALMQMVNEAGRHIMQGGSRRAAIWAGLHWYHPDVFKFITLKDWTENTKAMKEQDFNYPAPMDGTNISVILDDDFFSAFGSAEHPQHQWASDVYWACIEQALQTGEPGFSINTGADRDEVLRNACTEISSADNDDICNLGSINLARVDNIEDFTDLVDLGTKFLLCGSLYSTVPYEAVAVTREKNRRLGLGLMGFHEWLLVRGKNYGPDAELQAWLEVYATSTERAASYADELGCSRPIKTRAIAPTGTIAIVAETTSGIEPVFCAAYKRRYWKHQTQMAQYVVDAAVQRLMARGVDPETIEDAYTLAADPERRLAFQAFVQRYVDHGISSTLNLPPALEQSFTSEEFGKLLMQYLPQLRGVTVYPDGARGGQPLNRVSVAEALDWVGVEFEETGNERACVSGVCGA